MADLSRSDVRLLGLLKVIYDAGQISRTDLVEQTGYSPFLVSKMCDELLESRFIRESRPGNPPGGSPPPLVSIDADSGKVVGLHIGTIYAPIVTHLRNEE